MTFSDSLFFLLVIVLSMDAFTAGFSYGIEKVRVPFSSACIVAFISGTMLALSFFGGTFLAEQIPEALTKSISFLVLLFLALYKFYDTCPFAFFQNHPLTTKVISKKINRSPKEVLSLSEALILSLALSIDNVSAGLCCGISLSSFLLTISVTILIHLTALVLGTFLGKFLSQKSTIDFSLFGAVILLLLAISRLL